MGPLIQDTFFLYEFIQIMVDGFSWGFLFYFILHKIITKSNRYIKLLF